MALHRSPEADVEACPSMGCFDRRVEASQGVLVGVVVEHAAVVQSGQLAEERTGS
jgi:hypothetical protein